MLSERDVAITNLSSALNLVVSLVKLSKPVSLATLNVVASLVTRVLHQAPVPWPLH